MHWPKMFLFICLSELHYEQGDINSLRNGLGRSYSNAKEVDEAVLGYLVRGFILDRHLNQQKALKHFLKALEYDPSNCEARIRLADSALRSGQIGKAAEHLAAAQSGGGRRRVWQTILLSWAKVHATNQDEDAFNVVASSLAEQLADDQLGAAEFETAATMISSDLESRLSQSRIT